MRIFCTAKDPHIFPTKNNSVFVIFMFWILTKRLIMSLILNNWALSFVRLNGRFGEYHIQMSCIMRKLDLWVCEKWTAGTVALSCWLFLLPSLYNLSHFKMWTCKRLSSVAAQAGLYLTWIENQKLRWHLNNAAHQIHQYNRKRKPLWTTIIEQWICYVGMVFLRDEAIQMSSPGVKHTNARMFNVVRVRSAFSFLKIFLFVRVIIHHKVILHVC